MDRLPRAGELYRDAADRVYQIAAMAVHAQTGEQMVVYQAMFGDFGVYTRPLQQFLGETDYQKYPQAVQQHLFEKIETIGPDVGQEPAAKRERPTEQNRPRTQSPAESRRVLRQHAADTSGEGDYYYEKRRRQIEEREQRREMFRKSDKHESATEELRANPCLMRFLEAQTYEERFQVLNEIRDDMTDRLIDDIAVVLDVVIPEGDLEGRFYQLRNIILTRQKYEINRFR